MTDETANRMLEHLKSSRFDRLEHRVERIERRLELLPSRFRYTEHGPRLG